LCVRFDFGCKNTTFFLLASSLDEEFFEQIPNYCVLERNKTLIYN
jgi:hypothetical protein